MGFWFAFTSLAALCFVKKRQIKFTTSAIQLYHQSWEIDVWYTQQAVWDKIYGTEKVIQRKLNLATLIEGMANVLLKELPKS